VSRWLSKVWLEVTKIPLNLSELCEMTKVPLLSFSFPFLFYSSSTITFFFLLSSLPPPPPTNNNFPQSTSIHNINSRPRIKLRNLTSQNQINSHMREVLFYQNHFTYVISCPKTKSIFFLQFEQTHDLTVRELYG